MSLEEQNGFKTQLEAAFYGPKQEFERTKYYKVRLLWSPLVLTEEVIGEMDTCPGFG